MFLLEPHPNLSRGPCYAEKTFPKNVFQHLRRVPQQQELELVQNGAASIGTFTVCPLLIPPYFSLFSFPIFNMTDI